MNNYKFVDEKNSGGELVTLHTHNTTIYIQHTTNVEIVEIVKEVEKMETLKKQTTQELVGDTTNRIIQGYESNINT